MIDPIASTRTKLWVSPWKNMGLSSSRFRVFALTLSALRLLNSRAHSKTLIKPMYFHQFHKHAFATSSDVFTWFCEVHKCMLEAGSRRNSKNNYKTNVFVIIVTKTPPQHQTICLHNFAIFKMHARRGWSWASGAPLPFTQPPSGMISILGLLRNAPMKRQQSTWPC